MNKRYKRDCNTATPNSAQHDVRPLCTATGYADQLRTTKGAVCGPPHPIHMITNYVKLGNVELNKSD